mgnify:CR=1 FL=1
MAGILGALNYQRKSGQFTLTKEEFNIVNLIVYGVSSINNKVKILTEAEMDHLKVDLLDYQDFIKKNDVEEITDTLLNGRTVVINMEGLNVEIAQRIIDFTSGATFAMRGNLQKISNYIFLATPNGVDISGDIQNLMDSFDIPGFTV